MPDAVTLLPATWEVSLPVAWRLYLPREWAADRARRRSAGVPEEIEFQTKPEIVLAQELVLHGDLGDDSLLPPALLVELGFLPDFERLRDTSKEGVAPLAEGGGGDAILAARGLQIGATKQLQNNARFAFG